MADTLINRVANSGIITLNLEDYYPSREIVTFDLKEHLYMDLILKEKDFRAALKAIDWDAYTDNIVLVYCSNDAIIPVWAYMLVSSYLEGKAAEVYQGGKQSYLTQYFDKVVSNLDVDAYADKMVVLKGCGELPVPPHAYLSMTTRLKPVVKSLMYGEPCSTVPIYKKPKQ